MKRELLFEIDVPEHQLPRPRDRNAAPRVWRSVYDIPPGTLVKPSRGSSHLYVTSQGKGWWLQPDDWSEISYVEGSGNGWRLDSDAAGRAPFREVFR